MRHSRDFQTAVRRGRRVGRRTVVVHAAVSRADGAPARVGFIVSRAVGPAVTRNRVKRRLRAAMRERLEQVPAGALVVLRANPPAGTATSRQLLMDVDKALLRALAGGLRRGDAS